MLEFCMKNDGVIAVFLTLILLPMMLFCGVMIDGARIVGGKNIVAGAGDMATNAALAQYDEALLDAYGLIAMSKTPEELQDNLQEYFEATLNANGLDLEEVNRSLIYLELGNDGEFSASAVSETEIYRAEVMKQQIVEYMKYRAPVMLAQREVLDRLSAYKHLDAEKKAVSHQLEFESELDGLQSEFDAMKKAIDEHEKLYGQLFPVGMIETAMREAKGLYEEIAVLNVAAKRLEDCTDTASGDEESLAESFNEKAGELGSANAAAFKNLYEMVRIYNALGDSPKEIYKQYDSIKEKSSYEEAKETYEEYVDNIGIIEDYIDAYKSKMNEKVKTAQSLINGYWLLADRGIENCSEIMEKLADIQKKMEALEGNYSSWGTAVDSISEESSNKETLKNNREHYKELMDNKDKGNQEFKTAVEENQKWFQKVKAQLEQLNFCGYAVKDIAHYNSFYEEGAAYISGVNSSGSLNSAGARFMERWYGETTLNLAGVTLASLSELEFTKRVEEYCNEGNLSAEDKQESKNKSDDLYEQLKEAGTQYKTLLLSDDIENVNVLELGKNDLPSVWLGYEASELGEGNSELGISGKVNNKNNRKEISGGAQGKLNEDNSLINGISTIANKIESVGIEGMSDIYMTEYMMDMFSYYTVEQTGKKEGNTYVKNDNPEGLSGSALKDNALYRAEVEYMLWGDENLRDNITKTKAMIFAFQFTSNSIFAFTNRELTQQADAISLLFPVGPLGKTAIKSAILAVLSLVETTQDLNQIVHGEKIPLIKKDTTWETWLVPKGQNSVVELEEGGFSYNEYLWMFLCVNMFIPDRQVKILARAADCMELNLTKKKTDADASLKDAYTMIQIDASVKTNTFFMQRIQGVTTNGSNSSPLVDDNTFRIEYRGIQGY